MTPHIPGIRIQRLLGEGACGQVFSGIREGGVLCAVKVLDPEAVNHDYLAYCLDKILSLPRHQRLLPVYDFHPDDVDGPAHYVMGLLVEGSNAEAGPQQGRTLEPRCGRTDEVTAWRWLGEIAQGIGYLHTHAIVHCNLKPGNVFLTHGEIAHAEVADFGQGWMGGVEALALSDHVFYAPPEQLREPAQIQFGIGERWDVYAFGVLAFRLLTGRFPRGEGFADNLREPAVWGEVPEPAEFADSVEREAVATWPAPAEDEVTERRREIIDKCLRLQPLERWVDMREVRDALGAVEDKIEEARRWREVEEERTLLITAAEAGREQLSAEASKQKRSLKRRVWLATAYGTLATAAAVAAGYYVNFYRDQHVAALRTVAARDQELRQTRDDRDAGFRKRDEDLAKSRADVTAAATAWRVARENLSGAQTAADHFFGSFLDAARQLPPAADQERARLLVSAYDYFTTFVDQGADKPDLAEAVLHARCHLAEIKLAMAGGTEAAQKFDEAKLQIDQFLVRNPDDPNASALRLKAGDCALTAAKLRLAAGAPPTQAREQLTKALETIEGLSRRDASAPELLRRQAEGQWLLAESLHADVSGDPAEASQRLNRAADLLNGLLADQKAGRPEDKLTLARVYFLRGQIERAGKKIEAALATQLQTAELLLECGDQPDALFQLSLSYAETGEMLDGNGEFKDSARAHGEAIKLLSDLVKAAPGRTDIRFQLARNYGDVAQIVRDHGEPSRALDYERGAVELLKALVEKDPGNALYAAQLAHKNANLSDLLTSLGQKGEALGHAREAIALLDKLKAPGRPVSTADIDLCLNIAQTYGIAGHVTEEAQQKAEAAACFSKAVEHYESLSAARTGDDTIERGLTWSRMRLAKLKN